MGKQKILILGGGNMGLSAAVAVLLKQMGNKVVLFDDNFMGLPNLSELDNLKPPHFDLGFNETNYTPKRDHGWYRQFEKKGKKCNFKKAI